MRNQLIADICNQACILAGLSPIVNIYGNKDERASTCRTMVNMAVRVCLETTAYEFANQGMALVKFADGEGYQLPPHYIRLVGLSKCSCCCTGSEYDNLIIDRGVVFKILKNRLFISSGCSSCGVYNNRMLVYTSIEHADTDIPANLTSAITHLLAYYLCERTGSLEMAVNLYKMHKEYITQAKMVNEGNFASTDDQYNCCDIPYHGTGHGRLH